MTLTSSRTRSNLSPSAPLAQLTFYPDTILVTKYTAGGSTTHPVHPADIAAAFTHVSLTTGLLPPHTLAYARSGGKVAMAIFLPAAKHTVYVERGAELTALTIPLPPLIFAGRGTQYYVFALKDATPSSHTPLYHAPCPNVFERGHICQGNTPFPDTAPDVIHQAFRTFLRDSAFNTHLAADRVQGKYAGNVLTLWQQLHTRNTRRFPLRALVPVALTLGGLIHQLSHTPS
jgi:PRTRC genetic system protein B